MAVLTVTTIDRNGQNLTTLDVAAAGGGDSFANTGSEFLYLNNASGGAIVVTLDVIATVDSQRTAAVTDPTVSVPAGNAMVIGPFPTGIYNDGNDRMNVTYDGVTSLTVAAFKFLAG